MGSDGSIRLAVTSVFRSGAYVRFSSQYSLCADQMALRLAPATSARDCSSDCWNWGTPIESSTPVTIKVTAISISV